MSLTEFLPAHRTEKRRLAAQARYFTSEWFFREILDHVPEMLAILNADRQVVYANRALAGVASQNGHGDVVGLRPGEVFLCKHTAETDGGCGTTRFCRYCGAARAILTSQDGNPATEECRLTIHRNGIEEAQDFRVWARPIITQGKEFTFFAIVDIADEKRRQFLERLFLHDVMNTATALHSFHWLLLGAGEAEVETRKIYVERIGLLSARMIDEIESQRQLVDAETGELEVRMEMLDSAQIVDQCFGIYNHGEIVNGRSLRISPDIASVQFESDRALLQRVLGNMIKNALEGSVPGETITIGCRTVDHSVAFWVHNPTYIPENVRMQIFNRSFSTKGVGRGLGTYSMKYLTERYLGGNVSFESAEESGTTFYCRLPL